MSIIKNCLQVLSFHPEDWIEFSAGQNTATNLARFKRSNFLYSLSLQILGYLKLILVHVVLNRKQDNDSKILFFAVTPNQFNVLLPIAENLTTYSYSFVVNKQLRNQAEKAKIKTFFVQIRLKELAYIVALHFLRFMDLCRIFFLKPRLFFYRSKSIISVHFWLIYHFSALEVLKPRLVVVSNDHNAETRSLVEICKFLNIKTAYVQHAEVSDRFHSLDFDISFLWGSHSLEVYKRCNNRRPPFSSPPIKRYFSLVGSMRNRESILHTKTILDKSVVRIGLLLKGTDEISDVHLYIKHLKKYGEVIIRPHPNMVKLKIKKKLISVWTDEIHFSDPWLESANLFLSRIDLLISGNSTMSLEAAVMNVMPIYVESMSGGVIDYYGFSKNKVTINAKKVEDFSTKHLQTMEKYKANPDAIKYYNETYMTSHFGKEERIVVELFELYLEGRTDRFSEFNV